MQSQKPRYTRLPQLTRKGDAAAAGAAAAAVAAAQKHSSRCKLQVHTLSLLRQQRPEKQATSCIVVSCKLLQVPASSCRLLQAPASTWEGLLAQLPAAAAAHSLTTTFPLTYTALCKPCIGSESLLTLLQQFALQL
jgi:hypothetical protein